MPTLYQHPEYDLNKSDWEKWRDLYEGNHATLSKGEYLWYHALEAKTGDQNSANLRKSREQRTRYLNLIEILISLWTAWFFRKPPNLSDAKSLLGERLDDINGAGKSFESFIKNDILKNYLLYGKSIVLVENASYQVQTRAEEQALGISPKMRMLEPLACVDWDTEVIDPARHGDLNMFRYEFLLIEPRTSSSKKPVQTRYSHEYVRDSGSVTINRYKQPIGEQTFQKAPQSIPRAEWVAEAPAIIQLDEIPVVIIEDRSWVKEAAEECLRVHNLRSNRDNILYFQGYRTDYITGIDTANPDQLKAFSEYTKVLLPAGAGVIFTDPVSTDQYDKAIQQGIDTTFKVGLNLFRTLPEDSRVGQSAESMNEAKDNPMALVESSLEDIENGINQTLEHFAAFKGDGNAPQIELEKNISEVSTEQFLAVVQAMSDYYSKVEVVSKTIAKEGLKMLKLDPAALKLAEDAIDSTQLSTPRQAGVVGGTRNDLIRSALNGNGRAANTQETPRRPGQAGAGVSSEAQ